GDRLFRTTTLVFFVGVAAFLGTLFVVALFFQDGLGASPLLSGLSTFPEALGVMLGAQVATRIYPRLGPRRIIAAGLTSTAVFALIGAAIALAIKDSDAAPSMRKPDEVGQEGEAAAPLEGEPGVEPARA